MDNANIDYYDALWSVNRRLITNWIRLLMDNIIVWSVNVKI